MDIVPLRGVAVGEKPIDKGLIEVLLEVFRLPVYSCGLVRDETSALFTYYLTHSGRPEADAFLHFIKFIAGCRCLCSLRNGLSISVASPGVCLLDLLLL